MRFVRGAQVTIDVEEAGFTFALKVLQPRSVGTLHIRSRDPLEQASMDPKYLSHETDAQLFLDGMRRARAVAARGRMSSGFTDCARQNPVTLANARPERTKSVAVLGHGFADSIRQS